MARRKPRIYVETVKQRHVSHWDEDWLTREQLEQLHREARQAHRRALLRRFSTIVLILIALALISSLLFPGSFD